MYTTYAGKLVRLRPWRDRDEYERATIETTLEPNPWWGPMWFTHTREYFDRDGLLNSKWHSSFALELAGSGEWIGFEDCGRFEASRLDAWLGTYILPQHQNRGYGTEAKLLMQCHLFENFPLEAVWADTVATHAQARAGLERSAMRYVGRQRGVAFSNGQFADRVFYSITREQWEQMPFRHEIQRG